MSKDGKHTSRVWIGGAAEMADDVYAVAWIDRDTGEILGADVAEQGIGIGALAALYRELAEEHGAPGALCVPTREQAIMLRKAIGVGVEINSDFDAQAEQLFEGALEAIEQELVDEGEPVVLEAGDPVYELKVTLRDVEPPVWRTLRVDAAMPLDALHAVLNAAMGWQDSHLHLFDIKGTRYHMNYEDAPADEPWEGDFVLGALVDVGDRFSYDYDFGDGWEHDISVERQTKAAAGDAVAICVAGARACPPEDCGGPPGYANLLAAIDDPSHDEHAALREWLGDGFDPEAFALEDVNADLDDIFGAPADDD